MPIETLANPLVKGIGSVNTRTPQARGAQPLPAGLRVISADGHFEIAEDIFFDRLPEAMKPKAPRLTFDGVPLFGGPPVKLAGPTNAAVQETIRNIVISSVGPGAWDMDRRTHDLVVEGVEKELMFPHSMLSFIRDPDLHLQEHLYSIYNEYLAEACARDHRRYYGVGICNNWWEPAKARQAVRQIADLGLRAILLPTLNPGKAADGTPINYGGDEMEAFWSEAAAAKLPVSFHVGENVTLGPRGAAAASILVTFNPFRKPLGELMFGGVLDRHPDLKILFAEGGLAWVPPTLQDAEGILDFHRSSFDYLPKRRPSEYWADNCYATFMNDKLGLSQIDYIGVDNAMWSSDYPHNESTLGYGWDSVAAVLEAVGEGAARKILGENAIKLFRMDED